MLKTLFGFFALLQWTQALNILQIVPGFTNSHVGVFKVLVANGAFLDFV